VPSRVGASECEPQGDRVAGHDQILDVHAEIRKCLVAAADRLASGRRSGPKRIAAAFDASVSQAGVEGRRQRADSRALICPRSPGSPLRSHEAITASTTTDQQPFKPLTCLLEFTLPRSGPFWRFRFQRGVKVGSCSHLGLPASPPAARTCA
jgi:hypothetical protein